MKAALSAQLNKSDRNDARGIAHMMRVGLYRPVHVKTLASQKRRVLLTSRQLLQAKALDIENDLRGTLRNFGLKVGVVGVSKFEARIRDLVMDLPDLAAITEPLLTARRVLRGQLGVLHRRLLAVVRQDEVCRRLMTVPGVGPVVALTFRATVDVAARFKNSKAVGAVYGLTPRRHQSGEIDRMGSISKCGDAMVRTTLFEAAQAMLTRTIRRSWLKAWGMKIARHRGMKRAIVAVARQWQLSCIACGQTVEFRYGHGTINATLARRFRVLSRDTYAAYYNNVRTHLSLGKDAPLIRPIQQFGNIAARPILGGLHHEYCRT